MKQIEINSFGDPEVLEMVERPIPEIKENEVLVKNLALSINPVDVKTRAGQGIAGRFKDVSPLILGWDISGEIAAIGELVTKFKIGDPVFGMANFPGHAKAYAEYIVVPENQLTLKPSSVSHTEAAAATLAALTAWQGLVSTVDVKKNDSVLIHAAAGGVGHFAIQIAKSRGAYVIGTGSDYNREFVLGLGADEFLDYRSKPFEEQVSNLDVVFDSQGRDHQRRSLKTIKPGGKIISILGPLDDEGKSEAEKGQITAHAILVQSSGTDMDAIAELMNSKQVRSHIHSQYSFDEMSAAHRQVEGGHTAGKVVVTL